MTAVASLCMTILGRHKDELCHVLVNSPFDSPILTPKFYYPRPKVVKHRFGEKVINSSEAKITLQSIPYVRARYLFKENFKRLPGNYNSMVCKANQVIDEKHISELRLTCKTQECQIGAHLINLNTAQFVLYWMLSERAQKSMPFLKGQLELENAFQSFVIGIDTNIMPELINHSGMKNKRADELRKLISTIKTSIKKVLSVEEFHYFTPAASRGEYGLYPYLFIFSFSKCRITQVI